MAILGYLPPRRASVLSLSRTNRGREWGALDSAGMNPGAVGAVVAAKRRADVAQQPPDISEERIRETQLRRRKMDACKKIMRKFDTNRSNKLERDQVVRLLTEMDHVSPSGTPPSDEEVAYILKVAGGGESLRLQDLETAIVKWSTYVEMRDEMQEKLKLFDKSRTGKLEKEELQQYLVSLNEGKPVTEEEVDWVLEVADIFGDGGVNAQEMVMATSCWYAHVEERHRRRCVVQ